MRSGREMFDGAAQWHVLELDTRRSEAEVFTLTRDGVVLAAAQVGPPIRDLDPEPPDLGVPPRLLMAAAAVLGHGYAKWLVRQIRHLKYPDLVHDGCLSDAGERLVTSLELPLQPGKELEPLDSEKAEQLAAELLAFATNQPNGSVVWPE